MDEGLKRVEPEEGSSLSEQQQRSPFFNLLCRGIPSSQRPKSERPPITKRKLTNAHSVRVDFVCRLMCYPDVSATLQMGYIGVGVRVEGTRPRRSLVAEGDGVTEVGLEQALRLVLSEGCVKAAGRYRELLADEDGVEAARAKISAIVDSHG